jgi:hypothetical protein
VGGNCFHHLPCLGIDWPIFSNCGTNVFKSKEPRGSPNIVISMDSQNDRALEILQGGIIVYLCIEHINGISPLKKVYNFAEDIQIASGKNSSHQCCPYCTASSWSMTYRSTVKMTETRIKWQGLI